MAKTFDERKRDWWEWHKANPLVWKYFERFSMEAVERGRRKISHWLIINRIRWEVNIVTTGEDFKISNDYIAFYARLWKARHPAHKDLFNIKRMVGEHDDGEAETSIGVHSSVHNHEGVSSVLHQHSARFEFKEQIKHS